MGDIRLSKFWRHLSNQPEELIRTAKIKPVSVTLPPPGKGYPILRTNALPVFHAITEGKPLKLRRKGKRYFAVVDADYRDDKRLELFKKSAGI